MSFPIKGFIETSLVDWPGKIAAVMFLPRCNFRCPYCHNYELVTTPDQFPTVSLHYIMKRLSHHSRWIDGVCITGGEPTLEPGLRRLIETLRTAGMPIKLDTNGSHPRILENLLRERLIDHVAMDVKAPLERGVYSRCAGAPVNTGQIRESLDLLKALAPSYELRTTVAPPLLTRNHLVQLAHQLTGEAQLTLQQFRATHTLDPRYTKVTPYGAGELSSMQDEVNQIIGQTSLPLQHAV